MKVEPPVQSILRIGKWLRECINSPSIVSLQPIAIPLSGIYGIDCK